MKHFSLPVSGMTCNHCTATVDEALRGVDGVKKVSVTLTPGGAEIDADDQVARQSLVDAVVAAGYQIGEASTPAPVMVSLGGLSAPRANSKIEVPQQTSPPNRSEIPSPAKTLTFDVAGMQCASCTARVEDAARRVAGVESAHVNLATGQAYIRAASFVTDDSLVKAIENVGYGAKLAQAESGLDAFRDDRTLEDSSLWRRQFILAVVFLLVGIIAPYLLPHSAASHWLMVGWSALGAIVVGWPFFVQAARILKAGGANMDSLVVLGLVASITAGALASHEQSMALMDGQLILLAVTLGRWLESRAKSSAWSHLRQFAQSVPKSATVEREGRTVEAPVGSVHVGETIVVRPGERIPLDAVVLDGRSEADEAWLTGESLPANKQPGDSLLAGTTNGSGGLRAKVVREASAGVWNAAADRMREALTSKSQWQRLADLVIRWFVPAVLLLAVGTFAGWLLAGGSWTTALFHAASVLVAACPCAMGLATPVALIVASGRAASLGIVFKNLRALERAEQIDTVLFDKTGTLTTGKLSVRSVEPADGVSQQQLLEAASSVETMAAHPAARAIVAVARERGLSWPIAEQFRTLPGRGAMATVGGAETLVASAAEMTERGIKVAAADDDHFRVHTALNSSGAWQWLGCIVLEDTPRAESRSAVGELKARGMSLLLVSGDKESTARRVGESLGIDDVRAGVTPSGKLEVVKDLQQQGHRVAVIGDGVNDAPALAAADLGIALGSGVDLALEAADVALPRNDLQGVGESLQLARRTGTIIRQNLAWAFGYNILLLPLATGALEPLTGLSLTPAMSAAAMAASSVCVVLNSLRLR